jgi:hypothetical protein
VNQPVLHVLVINYFYPPVVDAQAYRWEQIGKRWAAEGHRVEVITGALKNEPAEEVLAGVRVSRVGWVARESIHRPAPETGAARPPSRRWTSWLVGRVIRPLYRKVYWPDAWWHWLPSLLSSLWQRRHERYDMVVSFCPCFTAHIAGALFMRWQQHRPTWVMDYSDPFSTSTSMQPNNFALYRRLNHRVERALAGRADAVVFTNSTTLDEYRSVVADHGKMHVIPHLVDMHRLYAGADTTPRAFDAPVELVYVGGFHRGIREPGLLFDMMRGLEQRCPGRFRLSIYGPANGFDLSPADCPNVRYFGMVARERALDLMRQADVLVNVDNMNCVMVPSKIVELVGTGRPLVHLKENGVEHVALQRYLGLNYAHEVTREQLQADGGASVESFLLEMGGRVAPRTVVEAVLQEFTLSSVADSYQRLLGDVSPPRRQDDTHAQMGAV